MDADGKLFALPAYGTTQVLYYNKQIFADAGIDPTTIKTWQDLEAAAEKITTDSVVGWEPMWGYGNLVDAALSNGASLLSEDGETCPDQLQRVGGRMGELPQMDPRRQDHEVNSGGQGWEYWYTTIDDVLQNKAGGYTGSSGDQADLDFNIVGAIEQPGFNDNPSAPTADALQLVMLEGSSDEEKQGVYEFMKYFTTPENQAKWSMATGYVAVRESTQEVPDFKPTQMRTPTLLYAQQAMHGTSSLIDPTGGKILDALKIAADQVELENVPAQERWMRRRQLHRRRWTRYKMRQELKFTISREAENLHREPIEVPCDTERLYIKVDLPDEFRYMKLYHPGGPEGHIRLQKQLAWGDQDLCVGKGPKDTTIGGVPGQDPAGNLAGVSGHLYRVPAPEAGRPKRLYHHDHVRRGGPCVRPHGRTRLGGGHPGDFSEKVPLGQGVRDKKAVV